MDVIERAAVLAYLEEKREKLAAAKECGGYAAELMDEIIRAVKLAPQPVGFYSVDKLVPVRWPEVAYASKLRHIGEIRIADYLEGLQAEMQTHEAMFLQLKRLQREKAALIKTVWGDCDCCGNKTACARYPCYCIAGSAWEWEGISSEQT